jgi:hypothetical protein
VLVVVWDWVHRRVLQTRHALLVVFCISSMPIPIAARSEAWVLITWGLRSWVRIRLKTWMLVIGFLCCVVI